MKKLFSKLSCIVVISCLSLGFMPNETFAQCTDFTASTHGVTGTPSVTAHGGYSGNDSRVSATLNPMEASVWDDPTTSGFNSKYNNGTCGNKFIFPNGGGT